MKKFCIVFGTRPEIIKLSPLIHLFKERRTPFFIIHTNQHYAPLLNTIFFRELNIPAPAYRLHIGSGTHAQTTARALVGIERILYKEKPRCVIVQGDTNTTLAGALASVKLHIPIAHVEAGLRSYDRAMPEEINRIMVDHCADALFTPTVREKRILQHEGVDTAKIFVTGNTIVDAVRAHVRQAHRVSRILSRLGVERKKYILLTVHRQENADVKKRLNRIFQGASRVARALQMPVIYPTHYRSTKRIRDFGLTLPASIRLIEPVGFLDFLMLQSCARIILTDSGGVQEEACILGVPCVTVRDNTERIETLRIGSNMLAGADQKKIVDCAHAMLVSKQKWKQPYGDGKTSEKIAHVLEQYV